MAPTREAIIDALRSAFGADPSVRALWEGGSTAFGAADEFSDIDLQAIVVDGAVARTVETAERVLRRLAPIEVRWEIPQPTWHGHWQCFYRLEGTSPHLFVDLVIMERSNPRRFVEREIHGEPRIHFDHDALLVPPPLDRDALAAARTAAIRKYRDRRPLAQSILEKELARGRVLDAFHFYKSFVLDALVHVLRIRHCPVRHDFGWRYLDRDLPAADVARLRALALIPESELAAAVTRGLAWLDAELATLP